MIKTSQPLSTGEELRWEQFGSRIQATKKCLSIENPEMVFYALVDTRGLPALRGALERLDMIQFEALWDGTDLSAHKDVSPLLITVDLASSTSDIPLQLLRRLWKFSDEGFMVTWIWSPYALDELAAHFRSHCEYRLPDRRAFYLHFYDNRILERLRLTWTEEEQGRFASVAFQIWYRSRAGEDCVWCTDLPQPPEGAAERGMTSEQHLALLSLGRADKLASQIKKNLGGLVRHLSSEELYRAVFEQIERAGRYRISDELDMQRYVLNGLRFSPRFDEHLSIRYLLDLASHGDITFEVALSKIDEKFQNGFADQLSQ